MQATSRQVSSTQQHPHRKLGAVVCRHLDTVYRREPARHNIEAYHTLCGVLGENPRPLVLDSFCGTGQSTAILAARHPSHLIVGIDKSAHRLNRHPGSNRDNYLLLRADCEDIWLQLAEDGLRLDFHYLLYPNPWPKGKHLGRRIHGHPAFPCLPRLGGRIELRSNWRLYVEEFGVAMHLAGQRGRVASVPAEDQALSLFEHKYRQSGHDLWSYTCAIPP